MLSDPSPTEPPAITLRRVPCRDALSKCGIPGLDLGLNPYIGCAHDCAYCYASFMKRFTGHEDAWGTFVDVKEGLTEALGRQVRRLRAGTVMMSSVTDAWQPIEATERLSRACLRLLASSPLNVSILTKSDLVLQDLDLLTAFHDLFGEPRVKVGFSIPTMSDEMAAWLEPGAPPPSRRLAALQALSDAGIPTWVFVAPVLPGLADSPADLKALAAAARHRGAREVLVDPMNFYPAARHRMETLIALHRPSALPGWRQAASRAAAWRRDVAAITL